MTGYGFKYRYMRPLDLERKQSINEIDRVGTRISRSTNYTNNYSLRSILLFTNTNVSNTKMCLDISILAKSIMDRME
jgi:hypothetical protein